ncbi:MAG: T9SS type A sorting domain-containing protein [Bacteroidales bacterium]|nr:T9SS type A sorting domain-containing protein [Bacteroidales bacterium]
MNSKSLLIIVSIVILLTLRSISQTYFPLVETNKSWSISYYYASPPAHMKYIKFSTDTLIGALNYKVVQETTDSITHPWQISGYIRETANHRVYFSTNPSVSEFLLYDFALSLNDTVYLRGFTFPFTVDTLDLIQLEDGSMRQRYVLSNSQCQGTDVWIQGVGSMNGVLNSVGNCFTGETDDLVCMKQNTAIIYHNYNYATCDFQVNTESLESKSVVTMYPNPVQSLLLITFRENNTAPFGLFNIYGKKCKDGILIPGDNLIPMNDMQNGLYVFRISHDNANMQTSMIIVKTN